MHKKLTGIFCVCWGLVLNTAVAVGQSLPAPPDFSGLDVKVGDTIRLSDLGNGAHINGRVESVSPTEIWVDRYRFRPTPRMKIERVGDPIWEGAAVGFGLGSFVVFPIIPETFVSTGGRFRINNGLFWGWIGALIDRAHRGRRTIYKSGSAGD